MNKVLEMSSEDFDAAVKAKVEEALSSKEDDVARQEAEQALREAKDTFETLKAALEARDAKIKEYEEALSNLENVDPTSAEVFANEKIVELETALAEANTRVTVAEAALDTIAREETAAGRMAELEESDVSLDEEAAEVQYAKVRDMSDEEFQSYKSELVALKAKYAVSEETDQNIQVTDLTVNEIASIAQSLGCDPSDSQCITLVNEVAKKVSEVSQGRHTVEDKEENAKENDKSNEDKVKEKVEPKKEIASVKLSPGEAIALAMDQHIQAPQALKEEIAQAWEGYIAEKKGEKKS